MIFVVFVEEIYFLSLDVVMDGIVNNLIGWGFLLWVLVRVFFVVFVGWGMVIFGCGEGNFFSGNYYLFEGIGRVRFVL